MLYCHIKTYLRIGKGKEILLTEERTEIVVNVKVKDGFTPGKKIATRKDGDRKYITRLLQIMSE